MAELCFEFVVEHLRTDILPHGQTIDNGFALISNNRPYYVDIYTHRSVDDEQDFFHRLHRCIVSESSRQLRDAGLIDLFDLVEADISDGKHSCHLLHRY